VFSKRVLRYSDHMNLQLSLVYVCLEKKKHITSIRKAHNAVLLFRTWRRYLYRFQTFATSFENSELQKYLCKKIIESKTNRKGESLRTFSLPKVGGNFGLCLSSTSFRFNYLSDRNRVSNSNLPCSLLCCSNIFSAILFSL